MHFLPSDTEFTGYHFLMPHSHPCDVQAVQSWRNVCEGSSTCAVAYPAIEWLQAATLFHFSCIFFNSVSLSSLVVELSVSCHFLLLSVSLPLSRPQCDAANLLSAEKSDNQDL